MKTMNRLGTLFGAIAILTLGACADMNSTPYRSSDSFANADNLRSGYGVVQSIELVPQGNAGIGGSSVGVGTIAGALVGGIVGSQVGAGRGNTAATVIGAAGGAYVGHELENRQPQKVDAYRIGVRMNDGAYQTLTQNSSGGFRVGDRVRFEHGALRRD